MSKIMIPIPPITPTEKITQVAINVDTSGYSRIAMVTTEGRVIISIETPAGPASWQVLEMEPYVEVFGALGPREET